MNQKPIKGLSWHTSFESIFKEIEWKISEVWHFSCHQNCKKIQKKYYFLVITKATSILNASKYSSRYVLHHVVKYLKSAQSFGRYSKKCGGFLMILLPEVLECMGKFGRNHIVCKKSDVWAHEMDPHLWADLHAACLTWNIALSSYQCTTMHLNNRAKYSMIQVPHHRRWYLYHLISRTRQLGLFTNTCRHAGGIFTELACLVSQCDLK